MQLLMPTHGPIDGVNIRNTGTRYADLVVDGEKTVETRGSIKGLGKLAGQRARVIRTGEGDAEVIGEVTFGNPFTYTSEDAFDADFMRHKVSQDDPFYDPSGRKVGFPLKDAERYKKPYPAPKKKGIQTTKNVEFQSLMPGDRFYPTEKSGALEVFKNELGYRVTHTADGKYRLYDPKDALLGIAGAKQSVSKLYRRKVINRRN